MAILYFIFGMLFVKIVLPSLESVFTLFATWIEKERANIIEGNNDNNNNNQSIGFSFKDNEGEDEQQ